MSFHRVGPHSKQKPRIRKNPAWDDSVTDLTAYKATPEEIMMRKESHKSKNHLAVKLEKMRKEQQQKKLTGAQHQQLAIMREILYDQQQLENVLAKSDRMMNVVNDLFGDDPRRFTGFPNVTSAPYAQTEMNGSTSLVAPAPDVYTRTEKLSDSVMSQSALNDIDDSDSEDDEETDQPEPISYESKLNLQRFQEYLQEEESKSARQDPVSMVAQLDKNQSNQSKPHPTAAKEIQREAAATSAANLHFLSSLLNAQKGEGAMLGENDELLKVIATAIATAPGPNPKTPPRNGRTGPTRDATPPSAINDTKKVRRTKKVTSGSAPGDSANSSVNMDNMKKVLYDLETELSEYEHQTGRQSLDHSSRSETFSGYTVALVNAVSRLTRYLKETELQIRTEKMLREQLNQDVYQLRTIIDALATDLIVTQEEYGKLFSEHQRYKENTEAQLKDLTSQVKDLSLQVFGRDSTRSNSQPPRANVSSDELRQGEQQGFQDSIAASKKSDDTQASSPVHSQQDTSTLSDFHPLPTQLHKQESAVAAIMLSPPVRKTRVFTDQSHRQDPPNLTQQPPVMNTVSVPRPVPLVQSNVAIPLPSDRQTGAVAPQGKVVTAASLMPVQENDVAQLVQIAEKDGSSNKTDSQYLEEALNNPAMQSLMQEQIRELNQQQEEARRRLRDLLDSQKIQQLQLQQQMREEEEEEEQEVADNPVRRLDYSEEVSPPISPISQNQKAAGPMMNGEGPQQTVSARGITVSLPMVGLDDSAGNMASPRFEPA